MGGPKVLLEVDGQSLLQLHVSRLREVGCREVVAVVPARLQAQVRDLVPQARVIGAITRSQAASLLVGCEAVPGVDVLVVTPVDVMPVRVLTLRRLIEALSESVTAVTPQFGGHGGHPVVLRREAARAPMWSLHARLIELGERRVRVPVDDEAVAADFNTLAELRRVLQARCPVG